MTRSFMMTGGGDSEEDEDEEDDDLRRDGRDLLDFELQPIVQLSQQHR
jgi:hypothetical protein